MSVTVEIKRVVHQTLRPRAGNRRGGSTFLVELEIDGVIALRAHVKRDVFDYLAERGVPHIERKR